MVAPTRQLVDLLVPQHAGDDDFFRRFARATSEPERGLWRLDEPILVGQNENGFSGQVVVGGMWPSQRKWWDLPNFVRLFVAGYGGGKTWQLCKRMVSLALINGPVSVAIVSPTYTMASQTVVPALEDLLNAQVQIQRWWGNHFAYWFKKSKPYEFVIEHQRRGYKKKVGRIMVYSGEIPRKLKGTNLAAAGIDEPFIQEYGVFEQMQIRCRHPRAKRRELNLTGCVTRDTPVWTRSGMVEIGSLDPGAGPKVYAPLGVDVLGRGGFHEATKFYDNGEDETVRLVAANGFELEATPDHPVLAMGADGVPVFRRLGARKGKYGELSQLQVGDFVAIERGADVWGGVDPLARAGGEFGQKMTADLAYSLGAYLAEGSHTAGRFTITCGDRELRDVFCSGGMASVPFKQSASRADQCRVTSKRLVQLFADLGTPLVKSPQRTLPAWVTAGKRDHALEFLAGMYDGDGHVTAKGQAAVGYTTTSRALAFQLQTVLLNLGVVARVTETLTKPTKRVRASSLRYQVVASKNNAAKLAALLPLRIPRKRNALTRMKRGSRDLEDVPHQAALVAAAWARREKKRWRARPKSAARATAIGKNSHEPNKIAERARVGHSLSYSSLADFVSFWDANEPETCAPVETLRANLAENFYWARVASLTPGRAETVDFVIPETHCFKGGGLLGCNTPEQ